MTSLPPPPPATYHAVTLGPWCASVQTWREAEWALGWTVRPCWDGLALDVYAGTWTVAVGVGDTRRRTAW